MHSALLVSLSLYAVLVLVGGIIGFVKANSRASLIAGLVSAALLGASAGLVAFGSARWGAGLGGLAALALIGRFLPAFLKTRKVMPAGLVVAVGAITLTIGVVTLVTTA